MGNTGILYRIRNIAYGRKATRGAVLAAPALKLEVTTPALVVFAAGMMVEDLTLPGHANMSTTRRFQRVLPRILAGDEAQWHLWEVRVYRQRMELDFADTTSSRKKSAAALRCYTEFPEEMDLKIWTPSKTTPYYHLIHLAPDETLDHLAVKYTNEVEGLEYAEVYESGPKHSEVRPMIRG